LSWQREKATKELPLRWVGRLRLEGGKTGKKVWEYREDLTTVTIRPGGGGSWGDKTREQLQ